MLCILSLLCTNSLNLYVVIVMYVVKMHNIFPLIVINNVYRVSMMTGYMQLNPFIQQYIWIYVWRKKYTNFTLMQQIFPS